MKLWELPEHVLFNIIAHVAAPTHRASVICHQLAPLCKSARTALMEEGVSDSFWEILLAEDYGNTTSSRRDSDQHRRASKRLRRSPIERVRDAHLLLQDNTEIAYFYLSELAMPSTKDNLTRAKLCRILDEYGPHLRVNRVLSSGGLYLVEVCRAQHIKESVILKCVQELVENRGALVNLSTSESPQCHLTALCVAAARGFPTVVKYLLRRGASVAIRSSGRFRLSTAPKKTVRCVQATPLEFAKAMWDAEKKAGATDASLKDLRKCIKLLEEHTASDDKSPTTM